MSREELRKHIFQLQEFIENEQKAGKDVDTILDETDIFDEFEDILPDDEFPIMSDACFIMFTYKFLPNELINID